MTGLKRMVENAMGRQTYEVTYKIWHNGSEVTRRMRVLGVDEDDAAEEVRQVLNRQVPVVKVVKV